jgi:hypothetical protein
VHPQFAAFVLGEIADDRAERISQHLKDCVTCRQLYLITAHTVKLLAGQETGEGPSEPDTE